MFSKPKTSNGKPKAAEQPDGGRWVVSRMRDVAAFFGTKSLHAIRTWSTMKNWPGKDGHYPLDLIAQWLRTEGPDRPANRRNRADLAEDPDDKLMAGPTSPAMERWRMARADREERRNAEEARQLVRVEVFRASMLAAFAELRKFAERQIKIHGADTEQEWNEAVERFQTALKELTENADA